MTSTSPGPGFPDLVSLGLLVAAAETGSLAGAGRCQGLSQPAASMRMRSLERQLGVTLLERTTRGSRLTPAGTAVVDWARPVLEAADKLLAGAGALRAEQEGRLRVAASMTVAEYLLPAWLVAMRARAPGVAVALRVCNSTEALARVSQKQAELGFIEGLRAPRGLRSCAVGADELVVVVAAGHPWARQRQPITVAQLAATPLVVREQGSGTREVAEALLAPAGTRAGPALELGSTSAVKAAVLAGEAPAVLSRLAVAAELADGRLIAVPVGDLALRRRFRAVWRGAQPPRGPARTLLALAAGRLGSPAGPAAPRSRARSRC